MPERPLNVFLDANIVIRCGKPPGAPVMPRIADLVEGGYVNIVTTDLTKTEVAKKHANNDLEEIGIITKRRFRELTKRILAVEIPDISADELHRKLLDKYSADVEQMFGTLRAKAISIDSVTPTKIFDAYARKTGLFSGEAKKDQFPDAFILEALNAIAIAADPIVIVTDDKDFDAVIKNSANITRLKSIGELFDTLGFTIEAAQLVDAFFHKNTDMLVATVNNEVNAWGLQVSDIEDAEIDESTVTDVRLGHFVTYATAGKDDDILVVGRMEATVSVSYTHPDWDTATYDSEDKVLLPHRHVASDKDITIDADFTMLVEVDSGGKPRRIEEFSFDDDSFIWVSLTPGPYDYK